MSMIKCKECGAEISSTAKSCVKCGAPVPRTKWRLWLPLGAVAVFLAYGAMLAGTPEGQQRSAERAVIEQCWADHRRESAAPDVKRFVASVCEQKERDFVARWGRKP